MLGGHVNLKEYFEACHRLLGRIDAPEVERLADDLFAAYEGERTVFLCGNGGSAANAAHFREDLAKGTLDRRDFADDRVRRFRAVCLADGAPGLLAWGNDEGFERVFVEPLRGLARPDDLLLAIGGSGESPNVLRAVEWANENEVLTWGVTGYSGGELARLARHCLRVPVHDMGLVESVHLLVFHWVLDDLYARIHDTGRYAPRGQAAAG